MGICIFYSSSSLQRRGDSHIIRMSVHGYFGPLGYCGAIHFTARILILWLFMLDSRFYEGLLPYELLHNPLNITFAAH